MASGSPGHEKACFITVRNHHANPYFNRMSFNDESFGFQTVTCASCTCGYVGRDNVEFHRTLALSIEREMVSATSGDVSLLQLNNGAFRDGHEASDFLCETCGERDRASTSVFLTTIPNSLIDIYMIYIGLKRFRYDNIANQVHGPY